MKRRIEFLIPVLAVALATCVQAGEGVAPKFSRKPTAMRVKGKVKITFAVSQPTDVAVYIEDAKGEVIRHLAAGVLGKNAPKPLRAGLSQELEWDGKANYGKPAEGGPFKVRVGLGLEPRYGGVVHSTLPDMRRVSSLAVGPDGTVYASGRVFRRDGSYRGTLGMLPGPQAKKYFGWPSETGEPDPTRYRQTKHMNSAWIFTGGSPGSSAVAVGPSGRFLYQLGDSAPPCINRRPLTAEAPADGNYSVKLTGITAQGLAGNRPSLACLALSSDGKYLYAGGLSADRHKNRAARKEFPAIVRAKCPERSGAKIFFGDPQKSGKDGEHLGGAPGGLAVDGKGWLFVADTRNNRVLVIDEKDGKYRGEIPTQRPCRLGFCPSTRALYVLGSGKRGQPLRRFTVPRSATAAALKVLKPGASMSLRKHVSAYLAVDPKARPPVIWIGGGRAPTFRIEDSGTGAKFAKVQEISAPPNMTKWHTDNIPFGDLQVDRLRKEIYCRVGGNGRSRLRYGEKTGKLEVVEVSTLFMQGGGTGLHLVPAKNGDLYGKQWGQYFYRWDRSGRYKAFESPRRVTEEDLKIGARPGKLNKYYIKNRAVGNMGVAMSVLPHTLAARWSDGHLFSIEPYRWQGKSVGGRTLKAMHEYLPSGKRVTGPGNPIIWKLSDATLGPRFDAAGNIYVAEAFRPDGWVMPPDLAEVYRKKGLAVKLTGKKGGHYTGYKGTVGIAASIYGSIVKFTPKGGMVHWDKRHKKGPNACGMEPFTGEPKLAPGLKTVTVEYGGQYIRYVKVTGAEWIHPGMSHVGIFGCNCENVTFDVDEFGRVFFPDPARFRLCVIDTAGNAITKFGGYGNYNYAGPDSPVVDPETKKLRARKPGEKLESPFAKPEIAFSWLVGVGVTDKYVYTGDSRNHRMLRTKITYAAEETCTIGGNR